MGPCAEACGKAPWVRLELGLAQSSGLEESSKIIQSKN